MKYSMKNKSFDNFVDYIHYLDFGLSWSGNSLLETFHSKRRRKVVIDFEELPPAGCI